MTTILVSGALANKAFNGGEAWVRLNWLLGFKRLGYSVYFVEQIGPETCRDAQGCVTTFEDSVNLAYFKQITEQFSLAGEAALIYGDGERVHGGTWSELLELAESADLLVNISGHLTLKPLLSRLRRTAYIDIDPGFTQFWHTDPNIAFRLAEHDYYFTIGTNIGTPLCSIPTGGIEWRWTRPPVVLDYWQVSNQEERDGFTTIANWRGPFGPIQYGGKSFGLKVHEFRKFIELPQRVMSTFEIALNIDSAETNDIKLLHDHGWKLVEPYSVAADPAAFCRYVQTSSAEFSVAQGIYVETESGWFSDRTAHYLASGKPVLVQDTGFSRTYVVGKGLVAFRTLEEAVAGCEHVMRDYAEHCMAARVLAEEYFDSDKVLGQLLAEVRVVA